MFCVIFSYQSIVVPFDIMNNLYSSTNMCWIMKILDSGLSNWRGPISMQKSRHYPGMVTLNEKVIITFSLN